MTKKLAEHPALKLPVIDKKSGAVNAIIETPQHSRNKFAYDPKAWLFRLEAVLPEGASFPHAFGFIPSTLGDDGDPLDVMVLMDEPAYPGCLVLVRLIGIISAMQTDADGTKERNDRLIAVAMDSHAHADVERPKDLPDGFVTEIEQFFVFYNKARGKVFEAKAWKGPRAAAAALEEGRRRRKRSDRRT